MAITLNIVKIEIDGKIYQLHKLNFGFQRKLIEVQTNLDKLQNELSKKYDIDVQEISTSEKVSQSEKLEVSRKGLELQEAIGLLFVNPEEAVILDSFDSSNIGELIEALK